MVAQKKFSLTKKYIATRPRAERVGKHGLFTSGDEPVVLSKVSEELNNHKGNVWTLMRRVYGYLLNERHIDRDVLTAFAREGLI